MEASSVSPGGHPVCSRPHDQPLTAW